MYAKIILDLVINYLKENKGNDKFLACVLITCTILSFFFGNYLKRPPVKEDYCHTYITERDTLKIEKQTLEGERDHFKEKAKKLQDKNFKDKRDLLDEQYDHCDERIEEDRDTLGQFDLAFDCALCIQEGYCK